MSEKIVQLHDKDGNNIYPVTNFTAISGGNESLGNAFVKKSGDTMTGNLKVPNLDVANDICRGYIYGETNSLNFRGGNPTTGEYTYLKIAEDGVYIDNQKIYYPGNKPTPADIGALSISGGTMTGVLIAQNNSNLTTKQVRNITISTAEPTASSGNVGDIWIVYKA